MSQSLRAETDVKDVKEDEEQTRKVDESKLKEDEGEVREADRVHQLQTPIAFNVISAPKHCPPGYRMDATGKCRKII